MSTENSFSLPRASHRISTTTTPFSHVAPAPRLAPVYPHPHLQQPQQQPPPAYGFPVFIGGPYQTNFYNTPMSLPQQQQQQSQQRRLTSPPIAPQAVPAPGSYRRATVPSGGQAYHNGFHHQNPQPQQVSLSTARGYPPPPLPASTGISQSSLSLPSLPPHALVGAPQWPVPPQHPFGHPPLQPLHHYKPSPSTASPFGDYNSAAAPAATASAGEDSYFDFLSDEESAPTYGAGHAGPAVRGSGGGPPYPSQQPPLTGLSAVQRMYNQTLPKQAGTANAHPPMNTTYAMSADAPPPQPPADTGRTLDQQLMSFTGNWGDGMGFGVEDDNSASENNGNNVVTRRAAPPMNAGELGSTSLTDNASDYLCWDIESTPPAPRKDSTTKRTKPLASAITHTADKATSGAYAHGGMDGPYESGEQNVTDATPSPHMLPPHGGNDTNGGRSADAPRYGGWDAQGRHGSSLLDMYSTSFLASDDDRYHEGRPPQQRVDNLHYNAGTSVMAYGASGAPSSQRAAQHVTPTRGGSGGAPFPQLSLGSEETLFVSGSFHDVFNDSFASSPLSSDDSPAHKALEAPQDSSVSRRLPLPPTNSGGVTTMLKQTSDATTASSSTNGLSGGLRSLVGPNPTVAARKVSSSTTRRTRTESDGADAVAREQAPHRKAPPLDARQQQLQAQYESLRRREAQQQQRGDQKERVTTPDFRPYAPHHSHKAMKRKVPMPPPLSVEVLSAEIKGHK